MKDNILGGAVIGGASSAVIATTVISAIGFGAGGIVAGSWAAGMMSAAAIAAGGGVAAGSTVAVLQTAGAAGLFAGPIGWIALAVGVGIGGAVGAIAKTINAGRDGGRCFAGVAAPPSGGNWCIGTEEGTGNVRLYVFSSEDEAWRVFNEMWVSRIIYNHEGNEVACNGLNGWAIDTVRRDIGTATRLEREAMAPNNCGPLAGCIIAFRTRHGRYLSAHPNGELCVEDNPLGWETFRLFGIENEVNKYAAKSAFYNHNKYIQIANGIWSAHGSQFGINQILTLEIDPVDSNYINIRGYNGKYISIDDSHKAQAFDRVGGDWERFQLLIL